MRETSCLFFPDRGLGSFRNRPGASGYPTAPTTSEAAYVNDTELSGKDVEALVGALLSPFPTPALLRELVWIELERNLDEFTEGPLRERVLPLIRTAEAEGWTARLIEATRRKNPGNPMLARFGAASRGAQVRVAV